MGNESRVSANYFDSLWKFFASVKLTVVVLLSLAVLSIIGTLIPQNQSPAEYFKAFGPFKYQLLATLDIFDMYNSWWFQLLIILLVVNIIICSIDRLRVTGKVIFNRSPKFKLQSYRNRNNRQDASLAVSAASLRQAFETKISKEFRYCRVVDTDNGYAVTAEKGRWTRLGVYGVHLSVVVLLVGSLIGSLRGFEGWVNIAEGETVDTIQLRNSNQKYKLPFAIRCDDFNVQFYDTGAPKEFRSALTIVNDGTDVLQKDIIVNDPLRHAGINIFQSSYGELPAAATAGSLPEEIELNFRSTASGMIYKRNTTMGEPVDIPEGLGRFVLKGFDPAAKFRGMDIGPAVTGILTPAEGAPLDITLAVNFPKFDIMRKGKVVISVASKLDLQMPEKRYYTGLQVTHDPGVWMVYVGFSLMILGCWVTFFMSHQQLVVEVRSEGSKCKVMVAGKANKNKIGMNHKIERLAGQLVKLGSA